MKYDDVEKALADLERARGRKRDMQMTKAQAEIDAINREYEAYLDGIYDLAKALNKVCIREERDGR